MALVRTHALAFQVMLAKTVNDDNLSSNINIK